MRCNDAADNLKPIGLQLFFIASASRGQSVHLGERAFQAPKLSVADCHFLQLRPSAPEGHAAVGESCIN
jgi:hypothetical protein